MFSNQEKKSVFEFLVWAYQTEKHFNKFLRVSLKIIQKNLRRNINSRLVIVGIKLGSTLNSFSF